MKKQVVIVENLTPISLQILGRIHEFTAKTYNLMSPYALPFARNLKVFLMSCQT
ncbi:MAG TPA: hypothetical protein PLQ82_08550 [Desulfobacteraceae bacterium]|nr:hypothetical protein [Desulfobacteraceae bacterium]